MISHLDPRTVISASRKTGPSVDANKQDPETLKKICLEFEAIFFNSMVKAMRKTIPDGGLFPKDNAQEMYQEMLDMEISNAASRSQSIGLADMMYRQIQRMETQK
jgi:flagellar protein FlgJ